MRIKKDKNKKPPTHHMIVENADWSSIMEARKKGIPWIELRTRNGLSALGMAIFDGSALATQTLLELGVPNLSDTLLDGSFFSPMWSALEKKKPAILDILLQAGSDPNEIHPDYGYPITFVSERSMSEETVVLCKHGAIPNTDSTPSPLLMWIKNLKPQLNEQTKVWKFPDSTPLLSLLKNGARIHIDEQDEEQGLYDESIKPSEGINEIDFARKIWSKHTMPLNDKHMVEMTLSLMEKNLLKGIVSDAIRDVEDEDVRYKKISDKKPNKI